MGTKTVYAIKVISRAKIEENEVLGRLLQTEVKIMSEIHHPNILHCSEFLESPNNYYLVLDFCNQGDFHNYLKKRNLKFLPEPEAVEFLK